MTTLRRDLHAPDPAALMTLSAQLRAQAFAVIPDLLPPVLLRALEADCAAAELAGRLHAAGTGRGAKGPAHSMLRGDSILWLDGAISNSAQADFLGRMDALRVALNRELLLGLHELEAHYATYPAGAGYARHRDRFRDDDARVVSLVVYLNDAWRDEDGGELRLHLPGGARDVLPRLGTSVLFLSEEIEHEVLPGSRTRRSIAGWFRRRDSRALR